MLSVFQLSTLAEYALFVLIQRFLLSTIRGITATPKKFGVSGTAALALLLVQAHPLSSDTQKSPEIYS